MENTDILLDRLPGVAGDIGLITLNRPAVLNVLNRAMCLQLDAILSQWESDPGIKAILIQGAGERAFCAGGDIKGLYQQRPQLMANHAFFADEYRMNQRLRNLTKPYIAFLDGITMGGGVGVSMHGSHRIATEHLRWAMPETLIGFFPDVGTRYDLSRLPDYRGYYLGLTGATINAHTAYAWGLVDQIIPRAKLAELTQALLSASSITDCLTQWQSMISADSLNITPDQTPTNELMATCFSKASVTEIVAALIHNGSPEALHHLQALKSRSPTSLVVTLALLQQAQSMTFEEVMAQDLAISDRFLVHPDFYEGIRAALVDKDKRPHWQTSSLDAINLPAIADFFGIRVQ